MKSMLKLLPHLIVTEILFPNILCGMTEEDTALTKFPMCGMRRLSKQAVREYATPAIFSAKNDICFGGKQVVCRCQTISGGLYA